MRNRNALAKLVEAKGLASSKTVYNVLDSEHPPTLPKLAAIAEALGVPLWMLMIPDVPGEVLTGAERIRFEQLVRDYFDSEEDGRNYLSVNAKHYGAAGRSSRQK